MSKLQGSWIWYELLTTDPVAAKAFYEPVLGWTITLGTEPPLYYSHIANPDGGSTGGMMALSPDMQAHGARPMWTGYVGVDDVDAALAQVVDLGGKVLMPKMSIDVGSFAMVSDCCGAPFYVMTPIPAPGSGPSTAFSPTLTGRCGWNELMAGNIDNALAFYTELFGWDLPDAMDMGDFGKYHFLSNDGVAIGAMMQKAPHAPAAGWNHYFRVASIAAARTAIEAGGGQVIHGPMEVPGGDWVVNGIDLQGAHFSLVGAKGD
ncbi:MAG: VOC family protein [Sphingomonadales bacterium]|nr:VOC family protein [Sphingomonadales bacterium]